MDKALYVGMRGFIGSVLRYGAGGAAQQLANNPSFPFGTLTVNLVGFLSQPADVHGVFTPEARKRGMGEPSRCAACWPLLKRCRCVSIATASAMPNPGR